VCPGARPRRDQACRSCLTTCAHCSFPYRNVAIAYPLRADNYDASIWTRFQDAEYLLGDAERFAQDQIATNLFCSGAIATWKLDILARVLERCVELWPSARTVDS
jgi:hypothetical protein